MSLTNSRQGRDILMIPDSLSLDDEVGYGGVMASNFTYVSASPEGPYLPQQTSQIQLPLENMMLKGSSLQFRISGTAGAGATYTRFNNDIRSIIKRLFITIGGKLVYDVQNYNVLCHIHNYTKDVNWQNTTAKVLYGYGSAAERNGYFTNPNKIYAVELYDLKNDFFRRFWPLTKIGGQVILNIFWALPSECMESDGTNPTYAVNGLQFHYQSLVVSPEWNNLFNEKVNSDLPPTISYPGFYNQIDTSTLNVGLTTISKVLTFRYASLVSLIIVMRNAANVQNLAFNDKLNSFNYNNINNAYVKIGGIQIPINSTVDNADLLTMYLANYGISNQFPLSGAVNWGTTSFVLAFPLSKYVYEDRKNKCLDSGLDLQIATNFVLNISFSTPLAATQQMDIFCVADNTITILPNGSIQWTD